MHRMQYVIINRIALTLRLIYDYFDLLAQTNFSTAYGGTFIQTPC